MGCRDRRLEDMTINPEVKEFIELVLLTIIDGMEGHCGIRDCRLTKYLIGLKGIKDKDDRFSCPQHDSHVCEDYCKLNIFYGAKSHCLLL